MQQLKKKCIRITNGPLSGVVMRRPADECAALVQSNMAGYASKGTLRSFLNQFAKQQRAYRIATRYGITDWNELPDNCAIATYGNGVTSLYVVPKGMNALDSLKAGYTTNPEMEEKFVEAREVYEAAKLATKNATRDEKIVMSLNEDAALDHLKNLLRNRTNIGTHYFLEKAKRQRNVKINRYNNTATANNNSISPAIIDQE